MPVFEYKGLNEAGKTVNGVRDADNSKTLRAMLRKEGIYLTEVSVEKQAHGESSSLGNIDLKKKMAARITSSDIAIITRQLAVLIGAGVALVEALNALQDQVDHQRLKWVVSQVKTKVNEGSSLADALAQHPKAFSNLYVNMVRAGEHSGALDVVLLRLADFTESQARLRSKIIGTMTYPVLMVFIGLIILTILFTVVMPKVTKIFEDNKITLPLTTRMLVAMSNAAQDYWWLMGIAATLAIYGFMAWKKTPKGQARWDEATLKTPIFGKLIRMIAIARFSRTLATLLKSGVPLLSAMDIVKNIVNNTVLANVIEKSRDSIREGESIAAPLKRSGQFPPLVYHMVSIGERSGQLEDMLVNVALAYENQVEVRITALTALLEPVMIVAMGATVAFIVFSILLPILQLNTVVH